MTITVGLVVARYDEPIDWIDSLLDKVRYPQLVNVTVYNKGVRDTGFGGLNLPNVGREAHTYLHHIVSRYDAPDGSTLDGATLDGATLDDYTVFCQGRPTDHCQQFVQRVADYVDSATALPGKPDEYVEFTDRNVYDEASWADRSDAFPWLPLRKTYEALFGRPAPHDHVAFAQGAMFGVSRERILHIPLEKYKAALEFAEVDPKAAWAFERLWRAAFFDVTRRHVRRHVS